MRRLRALLFRLGGLFRKTRREKDLAAEMESHLAMHIEDNLRAGMSAAEARRQALMKLGGVEQTKENYRERREENLRSLALRVAQQVRNYRRSIALEAMPPHERRIVHIALSESKDISTESIGEGEERRVVISLKRPGR